MIEQRRSFSLALLCVQLFPIVASGQPPELIVQMGHTRTVDSLAFSPDGQLIASGSSDEKTTKLWEATTGKLIRTLAGGLPVLFSPDGKTLLSGGKLWDTATGTEARALVNFTANCVAFSPDGKVVAGGCYQMINLWNAVTGELLRTFTGHKDMVLSIAFTHDGKALVSDGVAGIDGIRYWDLATGKETGRVVHDSGGAFASFSSNAKRAAIRAGNGSIMLWDLIAEEKMRTIPAEVSDEVKGSSRRLQSWPNAVALSSDGRTLAGASWDHKVGIWDVATGKKVHTLIGHTDGISSLAFSPHGTVLATGSFDTTVKVWDLLSGTEIRTLTGSDAVHSAAFSSDGKSLASLIKDKRVDLWELRTGKANRIPIEYRRTPTGARVAFRTDRNMLAIGQGYGIIEFWDTAVRERVLTLTGYRDPWINDAIQRGRGLEFVHLHIAAFSPDGKTLARAGKDGDHVEVRDVVTGKERIFSVPAGVFSIACSPDGHSLAIGKGNGEIELWDLGAWKTAAVLSGHADEVKSVAFDPGGRVLASMSEDMTIKLWDLASKKPHSLAELHAERTSGPVQAAESEWKNLDDIYSLAFLAHTEILASTAYRGDVELWDLNSRRKLCSLVSFSNGTWAVVDPDGRFDTNNLDDLPLLSWIFRDEPLKPLPLEIFMRDYYEPKLLPRLLARTTFRPVRSLASLNRVQPDVKITKVERLRESPWTASVTVEASIPGRQSAHPNRGVDLRTGIYDLRLFRDGQLVGRAPGRADEALVGPGMLDQWRRANNINIDSETGKATIKFNDIKLPRQTRRNAVEFSAYCFNVDRVKSVTSRVILPVPSDPDPVKRRAYIITVGVNANQSGWDLTLAVPSALRAGQLWRDKLRREYSDVVMVRLDSDFAQDGSVVQKKNQATKANLRAALDLLAGRNSQVSRDLREAVDPRQELLHTTPDDAVVVYIASHGYVAPRGTFYVIPYDSGLVRGITERVLTRCEENPNASGSCQAARVFLGHSISSDDLARWWSGIDAGELVMILDSCHSAAVPGREFRPGPLGDRGFGQLSYDKGMRILAAAQPDKMARATMMQRMGNTLLIEALKTTAEKAAGQSVGEWLRAAEHQLPEQVRKLLPEVKEQDVQLPELMDFAEVRQRRTAPRAATP